jgi:hypothetical protein
MIKIERIQEKFQPNILSKTFKPFGKKIFGKEVKSYFKSTFQKLIFKTFENSQMISWPSF